ncbi:trypsin-like peptidase domain-containing protein [Thalassococcus sp. CAU 1522]|uniref:Trypsin-like peptidase domain-containing protein n=2 Tax=Thalassococcus arenae TaxID=2851652 RepID=A0ABS6N2M3_9RHOB|nr:trypsin-like peptidase domain-containing protein [Thalassococcus arenae]
MRTLFAVFVMVWMTTQSVFAQQEFFYIQVEARTSLTAAQQSVRDYTSDFSDVNGFALGGGWYGVALGPFASRDDADEELRRLRAARRIPSDSYVESGAQYGQQFWPIGAQPRQPVTAARPDPVPETPTVTAAQPAPVAQDEREETQREALASERDLNAAEREELQIALRWAGFYNAAIDGAFGRGTRNAMAGWQRENGVDVTGVLTTRQRAALLQQYYAPLDGMGMAQYADPRIGITVELPLGVVSFDRYEAPFALFKPLGDAVPGARVLLISQPGDNQTLGGLYEIMQTLEIVPVDGERQRRRDSFVLTGANARIVSHTEASVRNGAIKGFTLVWPAGDEERRTRVLERMQASLTVTDGVLDPAEVSDDGQQIDLVSGLKVRKPKLTGSGFFVDDGGAVLASTDVVGACSQITLNNSYDAQIVAQDTDLGVAVLRPVTRLAPRAVAAFRTGSPRLQSEVAVAGFSFGGVLSAPSLTFGTLEDLRGLQGEPGLKRLALSSLPGDAGGPVLDTEGSVLGMLLPDRSAANRQLPEGVSFAADSADILALLAKAGIRASEVQAGRSLPPEDLTTKAAEITVLVSCWE